MDGWVLAGSVLAFLAVGLGAFGAHALRAKIPAERLAVYQTGVQYHMAHAIALVAVGTLSGRPAPVPVNVAGGLFVAGVALFSGSLYALAVTGNRRLGAVTPFGGLCFLAGWLSLAAAAAGL